MPQYNIKRKEQYSNSEAEPSLQVYLYLLVYDINLIQPLYCLHMNPNLNIVYNTCTHQYTSNPIKALYSILYFGGVIQNFFAIFDKGHIAANQYIFLSSIPNNRQFFMLGAKSSFSEDYNDPQRIFFYPFQIPSFLFAFPRTFLLTQLDQFHMQSSQ